MTPETYIVGSSIFAAIVVVILFYGSEHSSSMDVAFKCPRCGVEMQFFGSGLEHAVILIHVVPEVTRLVCPQCGYSEKWWPFETRRKSGILARKL